MFRRKENFFVLAAAVILLLIVIGITVILVMQLNQTPPVSQGTTPTPSQTPEPLPTANVEQKTLAPVLYDPEANAALLQKYQQRKPLSDQDKAAKTKLLTHLPLGERSGIIYVSQNVIIDYVSLADLFQVEILSPNIESAKAEANAWLRSQGMSQDAICNYPVQFYLNYQLARQLRDTNLIFNPLAPGCK